MLPLRRTERAYTLAVAMGDGIAYELARVRTRSGDETTVYLVRHAAASTRASVVRFSEPTRLDHWCAATGRREAIVAGFFVRDPYRPLGEVRVGGRPTAFEPVAAPWAARRACVHVDGPVRLAPRDELAADPPGDLVQAGPMLVREGRSVVDAADEDLDGGGSATLVHRGHLLNRPYSNIDQPAPESRPVVTALVFETA